MKQAIIAIDGPAGAGKSTVSRRVAAELGFSLLDTGAIYRSVALQARRQGIDWADEHSLGKLAADLPIRFETSEGHNSVFLGNDDVSLAIRTPEMSGGASQVSAHPAVRAALLDLQRRLAAPGGVVLEGRDIGTVVLPDADVKFFLTASLETRARRRSLELEQRGEPVDLQGMIATIARRDEADSNRKVAPLRQASDAVLVDSSNLTIDQVVSQMVQMVRERTSGSDCSDSV